MDISTLYVFLTVASLIGTVCVLIYDHKHRRPTRF